VKTRFKILLGFLVVLVFLTFAILFASESSVSCEAESEVVDLEKRIDAGDILSVYFTVLKSEEFTKHNRRNAGGGDSYQAFTLQCPFSRNSSTDYTLLFIFNVFQLPVKAETYITFGAADFLQRKIPLHAENFGTQNSLMTAGEAFILSKSFTKKTLPPYLKANGFYIHSSGLNSKGEQTQSFIKKPFAEGTIAYRLGGNASPNRPPFICITYSGDEELVTSVNGYRYCEFDWHLYVTQARQEMKGTTHNGGDSN